MPRLKIAIAKNIFFIIASLIPISVFSQPNPEGIFKNNVKTVRFHGYKNQYAMPVYRLGSGDKLQLDFDDLDNDVKSYYYCYELCDYNWQPVDISTLDYVTGFSQVNISDYQSSSVAYTRYTHYKATLPDASSVPTRSGNYILKVFLDGDSTNLVFTRRMYVVDNKVPISAQVTQTFSPDYYDTRQRIRFTINTNALNAFSAAQQVKVMVLQNYRWDNAQGINVSPTFIRGTNSLEYNSDNCFVFPAGNEWRWLDMQSFSLQASRVDSIIDKKTSTDIIMRPEGDRSSQKYVYYGDQNGMYSIKTFEGINVFTQGDYATVHFNYVPPNHTAFNDKDVYLFGQLTDYQFNNNTKMVFNEDKGIYETTAFLKQGYYDYGYLLVNKNDPTQSMMIDGDHFDTENDYTILIYYRSFNDQSDELIGLTTIDSRLPSSTPAPTPSGRF